MLATNSPEYNTIKNATLLRTILRDFPVSKYILKLITRKSGAVIINNK